MNNSQVQAWDEKRNIMFTVGLGYIPEGLKNRKDFFIGINPKGLVVSELEENGTWRIFPLRFSTGAKDHTGKIIFEKDLIVMKNKNDGSKDLAVIQLIDGNYYVKSSHIHKTLNSILTTHQMRIVGNIYENNAIYKSLFTKYTSPTARYA